MYKELEQAMTNTDHKFVRYFERLCEYEQYKKVYISVVEGQIHVALWYKKHPARKQKNMTIDTLNSLSTYFISEYKMINEIANIDTY